MPACVAMFTEEVGVSPLAGDGGLLYQARVAELVGAGRSFARLIEDGKVVFKAEIGAATAPGLPDPGRLGGPRVPRPGPRPRPAWPPCCATRSRDVAPVVSLYVNDFNTAGPRRPTAGWASSEVGAFMSVLF